MEWNNTETKLPKYGEGGFLACWENQGNIILVCFVDIHGNYIIAGGGDTCGNGKFPKFSHWMPLPEPPKDKQSGDNEEFGIPPQDEDRAF